MADDGTIDTPSPQDVLAAQQAQIQQGIAGPTAFQRNSALGTMLGRTLFGNPQLQQANAIQNGLKQGASGAGTQQDGESDVDYTLRKLKAQRDAVADVSPQLAAQLNTQILTLGQKKFENSRLQASDARAQTLFDEQQPGVKAEAAADAVAKKYAYVVNPDNNASNGYKIRAFDMSDPTQTHAYQDALKEPNATPMNGAQAANVFARSDVQSQKAAMALAKAQATAGGLDDGALRQLTVESVTDSSALSRQPPAVRAQIAKFKFDSGITPSDEQSARTEIKALNSSATAIGAREGNISILQNSVKGMGNQVLQTLAGVERGNFQPLNQAIAAGKTLNGSGPEARYAAAIQSFVNDYARVVGGGSGPTTDSAKAEAHALLSTAQGPEAVKAVVDQLANKELSVVMDAGDTAVEALANPKKYRALMKIQNKAGIPLIPDDGSKSPPMQPPPAAPQGAAPQQPPQGPPAGAPQEGATSVSRSGKPMVFSNGHWQYQQ